MINVPVPNFNPEKLIVSIYDYSDTSIETQKLVGYYGQSIVNGRAVAEEGTRRAAKFYAEWWLNSRVSSDELADLKHFNGSGSYLVSANLRKGVQYTPKNTHNGDGGPGHPRLYPDIYLFKIDYKGGMGYPITHVFDNHEGPQRLIKNQEEEPREEAKKILGESAEYLGGAGLADPYEGAKFRLQNATAYVGAVGTLPIHDLGI